MLTIIQSEIFCLPVSYQKNLEVKIYKTAILPVVLLHNDDLHSLYSSPNIVRMIKSRWVRWAGHVACMGEARGVYGVLVGRPEGKRPLGRHRCRWEDNIKMDLREIGIDGANWI
jgi:hypothetical protein